MARMTPATSSASSETTRATRRSVSIRSRNESAGGFLARTSRPWTAAPGNALAYAGSAGDGDRCSVLVGGMPRSENEEGWQKYRSFPACGLSGGGADECFGAGLLDGALQPLAQVDLRAPPQQLARQADVGLADLRVVGGQRLIDDLRARLGDLDDRLGELEQRELVRVADVDRLMRAGLGEQDHPADQIVDVTERPRLRAVAEHRDRPVLQRLAQKRRDRPAVVGAHPRTVGVEDPHDRRVDALLAVIGHRQRLGVALGLVVDAARPDRVDVAPVGLRLRMDLRVAVDLAGGEEQEAGAVGLGQAERVVRAV